MTHRASPEVVNGVQAKLAYLRRRKAVLDDLIRLLEGSTVLLLASSQVNEKTKEMGPPRAGAA
jgi:hypothetical protein